MHSFKIFVKNKLYLDMPFNETEFIFIPFDALDL
jgi:hypothetical protein